MTQKKISLALIASLLVILPLTALNYLGSQILAIPFLPFSFFNWTVPLIPGPVITFGIDSMIDTLLFLRINVANSAKTAEQGMAIGLFLVMGWLAGWLTILVFSGRRKYLGWLAGLVFPIFMLAVGLEGENLLLSIPVLGLLFLAGLATLFWSADRIVGIAAAAGDDLKAGSQEGESDPQTAVPDDDIRTVQQLGRRQFLITLGASAATITLAGSGLGLLLSGQGKKSGGTRSSSAGKPLPNDGDPLAPARGTRSEYTPIEDHYRVFLELEPSVIEAESYILPIAGMVSQPLMLTVDDFYNRFDSFDQYVTLSCISGRVGTTLISTTKWTGISMQDIMESAGVSPDAKYLYIESADGFFETVSLDLIRSDPRIMLCHSWDDAPLPTDHGFPCRIWLPDRFGMKQPKWIVSMEFTDQYKEGYWVERGWSEDALVKATSVIDTIAVDDVGLAEGRKVIPVGGIAWAGDRQISAVQVRVDGGDWLDARLRTPLSETTWVIWRFDWPFEEGDHTLQVRCFEGSGTAQITEENNARPNGATGLHEREITV